MLGDNEVGQRLQFHSSFDANEEIQHVIVDSCATTTELSHSVAVSAETLPHAKTSTPHTKLPDALVRNWNQQPAGP